MRRILLAILAGLGIVFTSIVPATGAAISLTFPTAGANFVAGSWLSVATQTSVTPAISGGNGGTFRVIVDASNSGLLRLGDTTGVTASTSYNLSNFNSTSNGLTTISFEGAVADVSSALASLEFNKSAAGDSVISVSITEGTGLIYNNHYYEVISGSIDWETALKTSLTRSVAASDGGLACQGYLATITTAEEQAFAYDKVRTTSWIALGDKSSYVNAARTAYNADNGAALATYADDAASEGLFHWLVGPERGVQVTTGNFNGTTTPLVVGVYANWNNGEPNDFGAGEDATQMLSNGDWNDLPHTGSTVATYIVEYGGLRVTANQETTAASVDVTDPDHIGTVAACTPAVVTSGVSGSFTATVLAPPGAPTSVSATAGALQATVSWTAPAYAGSTVITGYKIEYSTDGGSTWTTSIANTGSTATSATVTGLSVADHRFRVSAINSIGTSTPSSASTAVTINGTVPGLPSNLTISHDGFGGATVSWQAPSTTGGLAITGYVVEYKTTGDWIALSPSGLQATVRNVWVSQSWSFRVAAKNAVGTGSFATKTNVPPAPYTGPVITNLAEYKISSSGQQVLVKGTNLDKITSITIDAATVTILSQNVDELLISVPALTAGLKDIEMVWESGGVVTHQNALLVQESAPASNDSSETKVNAGSFKGFLALYAKGYAGHRFSAKVGNDWVIVESLASDFERIVEYAGSGYEINLRIFIDRELVLTRQLVTK